MDIFIKKTRLVHIKRIAYGRERTLCGQYANEGTVRGITSKDFLVSPCPKCLKTVIEEMEIWDKIIEELGFLSDNLRTKNIEKRETSSISV